MESEIKYYNYGNATEVCRNGERIASITAVGNIRLEKNISLSSSENYELHKVADEVKKCYVDEFMKYYQVALGKGNCIHEWLRESNKSHAQSWIYNEMEYRLKPKAFEEILKIGIFNEDRNDRIKEYYFDVA